MNLVCGDSANPPECLGQPKSVVADDKSTRRTVILRISSKVDPTTLIADITADGSTVVSRGAGVVVIEASGQAIEKLREHEHIIAINEPQHLQMRRPSMTRGHNDTEGGL